MGLSNDERGWILTSLSAIACIIGALVICVDLIIQLFPNGKGFRIEHSNAFLSCSLSLSAGVMLFSSLYSILPSAKSSLQKGEFSSKAAAWTLIGCFLAGIFGINVLSRIFHHFIPSHIVDCDHTHGDEEAAEEENDQIEHSPAKRRDSHRGRIVPNGHASESTPLLSSEVASRRRESGDMVERQSHPRSETETRTGMTAQTLGNHPRPSLQKRVTTTVTRLVSGTKVSCDEDGPCYGYSDPCGQDCFKYTAPRRLSKPTVRDSLVRRGGAGVQRSLSSGYRDSMSKPVFNVDGDALLDDGERQVSAYRKRLPSQVESGDEEEQLSTEPPDSSGLRRQSTFRTALEIRPKSGSTSPAQESLSSNHLPECSGTDAKGKGLNNFQLASKDAHKSYDHVQNRKHSHTHEGVGAQHHHHVPSNAFLSLGLQTSIAIALHKLPEGFITYATNHANPSLGFSVFLALFIHNITEGFALALPLFLATRSRLKALLYTIILGGLSQPIGAAVAAIWLRAAETGRGDFAPGDKAYGIMFALTAGVMTSVGLSLLREGFELSHNRKTATNFVFLGMGILGISGALTA